MVCTRIFFILTLPFLAVSLGSTIPKRDNSTVTASPATMKVSESPARPAIPAAPSANSIPTANSIPPALSVSPSSTRSPEQQVLPGKPAAPGKQISTAKSESAAGTVSTTEPPSPSSNSTCKSIRVRKEWRALSHAEKADYIKSVKCLARLPSKLLGPSYRRWDDFQYVHSESRKRIHVRPLFLPWHRLFTFMYERIIQDECNFQGTIPYWDWSLDYQNITRSPIWSSDPEIGFGSNGSFFGPGSDPDDLDAGVVTDGAFAKFPIYHPGRMMLQRNFHLKPPLALPGHYLGSQWFDPNNLRIISSQTDYSSFIMKLEGNYKQPDGTTLPGPHTIIHSFIGGDMPDLSYAANDHVWSVWQTEDPANRTYEYLPTGGFPASLDDELNYMGLWPKTKVRDVMDTLKPPFCYRYE
ncbi:hypothetical protein PSTG_04515 [Puccinia striiformis f. sp. tritici PST-78]|uniref:Tyrosinase copper-binding domain-containing protein n=1 Tax=Puccinia striiformis f. sp. tritici PST-78 TaxID=1165861 RepID=A0A0L0VSP3_9BASI|nr:hypothetical protein PSTG_04515 [Puccinia striiformis f. sp. tritici PST-78]